jgi:hypothetical protein
MWILCHNGIARPQVADGGDSLLIWRVVPDNRHRVAFQLVVCCGANYSY